MSDDEYEYDDDEMEEEQFEYTDEEEDQDDGHVALENAYYNAKGLRESDLAASADAFEQVISDEKSQLGKYGPWSFKAMKQLVKLHLRSGQAALMMQHYRRLLECVAEGDVSPNAIEKGIGGMLERVASLYQGSSAARIDNPQALAETVYDATLAVFHPNNGACPNERLWFKTNLKYGQLLYEMNQVNKLQQVLKDLEWVQSDGDANMTAAASSSSSTQSLEIYALQIQLYSRQKDHKRLRETFKTAMAVRGGIPHPRTLALIQELGGKMHMSAKEYEQAEKTFFQAFKSYDEAGDPSRLRCLKYLVLASMLHASSINPFDSQEARPYRDDPEITTMTNLVQAFHNNDIAGFERILRQSKSRILGDEFIAEHIQDLLRTIRRQVLRRVIRPYARMRLDAIAKELNDIAVEDVESLLVGLILDGLLEGSIDRVDGILYKTPERGNGTDAPPDKTPIMQRCEALDSLATMLGQLSTQVTNTRLQEARSTVP